MAQQQQLINQMLCQRPTNLSAPTAAIQPEQIIDTLARNITEFRFDEEGGVTFGGWFARYEELFKKDEYLLCMF